MEKEAGMLIKLYLGANIHYPDSIKMQLRVSQDQALPLLYKEKQQQQQQQRTAHHSIQSSSHPQAHQNSYAQSF